MRKKLVLYASAYGSTRRYARFIAERLECPAVEVWRLKRELLDGVDTVIFGGWLCGGVVAGAAFLSAHMDWLCGKRLIVFITGSGEYRGTSRLSDIADFNFSCLSPAGIFYFRGDLCYRKMHWYHKFLINFMMVEDNKEERKRLKSTQLNTQENQALELVHFTNSQWGL